MYWESPARTVLILRELAIDMGGAKTAGLVSLSTIV